MSIRTNRSGHSHFVENFLPVLADQVNPFWHKVIALLHLHSFSVALSTEFPLEGCLWILMSIWDSGGRDGGDCAGCKAQVVGCYSEKIWWYVWFVQWVGQPQDVQINKFSFIRGEMKEDILKYSIPVKIQWFSYRLIYVITCEN